MTLREWQTDHLPRLRNAAFRESAYAGEVTIVAYSFPTETESRAFD